MSADGGGGAQFGAAAELTLSVPQSELRAVREDIEDELEDVSLGVSGPGGTGGGGGGGRGPASDIAENTADLVDLAEDRNRLLRELVEGQALGDSGGGGGGISLPRRRSGGGGGGLGGGIARIAAAGLLAQQLLGDGTSSESQSGETSEPETTVPPTPIPDLPGSALRTPDKPTPAPPLPPGVRVSGPGPKPRDSSQTTGQPGGNPVGGAIRFGQDNPALAVGAAGAGLLGLSQLLQGGKAAGAAGASALGIPSLLLAQGNQQARQTPKDKRGPLQNIFANLLPDNLQSGNDEGRRAASLPVATLTPPGLSGGTVPVDANNLRSGSGGTTEVTVRFPDSIRIEGLPDGNNQLDRAVRDVVTKELNDKFITPTGDKPRSGP